MFTAIRAASKSDGRGQYLRHPLAIDLTWLQFVRFPDQPVSFAFSPCSISSAQILNIEREETKRKTSVLVDLCVRQGPLSDCRNWWLYIGLDQDSRLPLDPERVLDPDSWSLPD